VREVDWALLEEEARRRSTPAAPLSLPDLVRSIIEAWCGEARHQAWHRDDDVRHRTRHRDDGHDATAHPGPAHPPRRHRRRGALRPVVPAPDSWRTWLVLLRASFGLPMRATEIEVFQRLGPPGPLPEPQYWTCPKCGEREWTGSREPVCRPCSARGPTLREIQTYLGNWEGAR
jgi:hypothetical protein